MKSEASRCLKEGCRWFRRKYNSY